jgi:hypothetical protein
MIVDSLAERFGIRLSSDRMLDGVAGRGDVTLNARTPVKIILYKPSKFINHVTG